MKRDSGGTEEQTREDVRGREGGRERERERDGYLIYVGSGREWQWYMGLLVNW